MSGRVFTFDKNTADGKRKNSDRCKGCYHGKDER